MSTAIAHGPVAVWRWPDPVYEFCRKATGLAKDPPRVLSVVTRWRGDGAHGGLVNLRGYNPEWTQAQRSHGSPRGGFPPAGDGGPDRVGSSPGASSGRQRGGRRRCAHVMSCAHSLDSFVTGAGTLRRSSSI